MTSQQKATDSGWKAPGCPNSFKRARCMKELLFVCSKVLKPGGFLVFHPLVCQACAQFIKPHRVAAVFQGAYAVSVVDTTTSTPGSCLLRDPQLRSYQDRKAKRALTASVWVLSSSGYNRDITANACSH